MPSTTPNISLNKGAHGDWPDFWEIPINQNWDAIDVLFDAAAGHLHTGVAGDGPQLDHADLLNIGTLTHVQLEAAAEKVLVSPTDTTADHLWSKLAAGANITLNKLNSPGNEQVEIVAVGGGSPWVAADEYGVKHTTPTSAPVAYTDNFNWPLGFSLQNADYATVIDPAGGTFDFVSTGYAAKLFVSPGAGDPLSGTWNGVVLCHIPHSPAQRCTLSITDFTPPAGLGDSVCFTLAVYSTHLLGAHLPQRYGVFLEVHATCISVFPLTYQVSHRVVIIPDSVTRIELPACVHTDIEDFKGCWELSLDQNGHVYVYWRRKLVYSTQTSPVSTPGPVQTYFATLTASLVAAGEPPYGAIGFGMRYVLGPESTMDMELRWFTATATDDLYHETAVCAGTPLVGPTIPDLVEQFLTMPMGNGASGIPGSACCPGGTPKVGDVLSSSGGVPEVWVEACGLFEGSVEQGYRTNVTPTVTPCTNMTAPDPVFNFTSGPDPWMEGTRGTAIITGLAHLSPSVSVLPSLAGLHILNAVWMAYDKLFIEYEIDDGSAPVAPDLTVTDRYVPANTMLFTGPPIEEATLEILSTVWTLKYDGSALTGPAEGLNSLFEMTVAGANPGVVVSSPTPGVTVGFTYVSPTLIRGEVFVPLQSAPPGITSIVLDVDNGTGPVSETYSISQATPLIYDADASSNVAMTNPVTVTIRGNLFRDGVGVTVQSGDYVIASVVRVNQYQLNISGQTGGGGAPDVVFRVSNGVGLVVDVPILSIGAVAPIYGSALPAPEEGIKGTLVTVNGLGFFDSTQVAIAAGLSTDPEAPYACPGNCHIVSRGINTADVMIDPVCGDALNPVNLWLYNPGVAPVLVPVAFTVVASVIPAGLAILPASAKPGEAIVGAQITGLNINQYTTLSTASPHLTITNIVAALGVVTFDLAVSSGAPHNTPQAISVDNPCSKSAPISLTVTEPDPVLSSIECEFPFKDRNDQYVRIFGTDILAGGALSAIAGCSIDSYVRISDTEIHAVLDLQNAVLATVSWTNPVGGSDTVDLTLDPEPTPVVYHTSLDSPTEGAINQDLYIYGRFLDPTHTLMVIALVGATISSTVAWTETFIHLKVNITGIAGTDITAAITGSILYPSFHVETVEAAGGGAPTVTSVSTAPTPPMEGSAPTITIQGTNLLQVATIEAWPQVPSRLGVDFIPHGLAFPGTVLITAQNDTEITGTLTLGTGLYPWPLDLKLYDAGAILLLTVASAFSPSPYIGPPNPAPVVVNTPIYDTISEVSVIPQLVVFTMADPIGMFPGELWTGANVTVLLAAPGPGPNDWSVTFFINAPGPYSLYCYRSILPGPDHATIVGLSGVAV
jgi:hypothetical protein